MNNERQFYICSVCGNMVGLIEDRGGTLVCCGQEMDRLVSGSVDAAQEKHVPFLNRQGGMLTVNVGSVPHPMTEEHHITWIAVAQGGATHRVTLKKAGQPIAQFCVDDGPMTVYAYCNLHGLWKAEATDFAFSETVCSAEFPTGCIEGNE